MKKRVLKFWLLGIVGLGLTSAQLPAATYITGEIGFTGGTTLNGPISSATAFLSFFGPSGPGFDVPVVGGSPTGSYAGVPVGTLATFNPFAFDVQPATPHTLWTFTVDSTTYSFEINTVSISYQGPGFLNIQGQGTAYITGFDPTPGTWSITDTGGNGPVFTFGNITSVPEPSSIAFLAGGFGLMLLNRIYRRK
jgi:PEP-CTERM motif.